MRYAIWYDLYNLKNVKNTPGGVLILVKLQASAKINTPPWVLFTFLKLYKWYQIAQRTTYQVKESGYHILINLRPSPEVSRSELLIYL